MTEFETVEAATIYLELGVGASMNFVTILFAYLIAAHLVGSTLPKLIAAGISLIYTMFQIIHFGGMIGNMQRAAAGGEFLAREYPNSWAVIADVLSLETALVLIGLPMLLSWLGSIYYMHFYVRRKEQADA
jgi:hypothetical protein